MMKLTKLLTLAKHREVDLHHKDESHRRKTRSLVNEEQQLGEKEQEPTEERETCNC